MLGRLRGMREVIGKLYQEVVGFMIGVLIGLGLVLRIFVISEGRGERLDGNVVVETM